MEITLYETPTNNHGCRGYDVTIEVIDATTGKVIKGSGCRSCWQVGHDSSESPIKVGTTVKLPEQFRSVEIWSKDTWGHPNGLTYTDAQYEPVTWDTAKLSAGFSHNELVADYDEPKPDCSVCRPQDLIICN